MVAQLWVEMEVLPVTATGKVARRELPEPEAAAGGEYAAPASPEEEVLAGIWAEVLGVERVGVRDNYFELGGDSILSILIATRARRAGLQVTPRHLFQHQTVAELAASVAPLAASAPAVAAAGTSDVFPLSPLQQGLLFHSMADPEAGEYLDQLCFALRG